MISIFAFLQMMSISIPNIAFNFNDLKDQQMMIVNDSVMGGLSDSQYIKEGNILKYYGNVSLKNNGGFASLRMIWPFKSDSLNGKNKLKLRVKGDGSRFQFRLRTNRGFDGAAYVFEFETVENQWIEVLAKDEDFIPSFRGRKLYNMPTLDLKDVKQMGFLIANKQSGLFSIDLDFIEIE